MVHYVRSYLSWYHLWTAAHHAAVCEQRELEMIAERELLDPLHKSSAITTVMAAVAFLESRVNELFQDAADYGKSTSPTLHNSSVIDQRAVNLMGRFWTSKGGERNLAVLDKYQMSLLLCGADKMDEGRKPYQDASLLVRLRNDLVHFKPATTIGGETQALEKVLAHRFPPNHALSPKDRSLWFPDWCLGAGCAKWARDSAVALADEWSDRLNLAKHYRTALTAAESELIPPGQPS